MERKQHLHSAALADPVNGLVILGPCAGKHPDPAAEAEADARNIRPTLSYFYVAWKDEGIVLRLLVVFRWQPQCFRGKGCFQFDYISWNFNEKNVLVPTVEERTNERRGGEGEKKVLHHRQGEIFCVLFLCSHIFFFRQRIDSCFIQHPIFVRYRLIQFERKT